MGQPQNSGLLNFCWNPFLIFLMATFLVELAHGCYTIQSKTNII